MWSVPDFNSVRFYLSPILSITKTGAYHLYSADKFIAIVRIAARVAPGSLRTLVHPLHVRITTTQTGHLEIFTSLDPGIVQCPVVARRHKVSTGNTDAVDFLMLGFLVAIGVVVSIIVIPVVVMLVVVAVIVLVILVVTVTR